MGKILNSLDKHSIVYHQVFRHQLDTSYVEDFDPDEPLLAENIIFETENKNRTLVQVPPLFDYSLFKFFLDGCRRTYKIAEMETARGKLMPIVGAQIAVGILQRSTATLSRYNIKRLNILCLCNKINKDDYKEIKKEIEKNTVCQTPFTLLQYAHEENSGKTPEYSAISRIQKKMLDEELKILTSTVEKGILDTDSMLLKDGSLQYSYSIDDTYFYNVVGLSKSFNLSIKDKNGKQLRSLSTVLTKLEVGQRTPVYEYKFKKRKIGTWFLRIRPKKFMRNPLDGVVKLEKVACTKQEKEDGLDTSVVNSISLSVLNERNVTCHGKDSRWPNHLYPIYLTEQMLKSGFLGTEHFTNIF